MAIGPWAERWNDLRWRARMLLVHTLPMPLVYEWWHRRGRMQRTDLPTARDVEIIEVQPGCRIATYWSDVPSAGTGPSASLYIRDEEVLRLDCFGRPQGHLHLNPGQTKLLHPDTLRLHFDVGSRAEQVERARFEVVHNTPVAQATNGLRRVRNLPIDADRLRRAADQMHARMIEMLSERDLG